jgi:hypothetical protein
MPVTIQDWGAVGEIVSAMAVVVTLVYLASQIRYARLSASDASRAGRADGVRDMLLSHLANPDARRAWNKADPDAQSRMVELAERLGMTPDEADLVWNTGCAWTYIHWAQFRSIKTPHDEAELRNLIAKFYSSPPMVVLWEHDPKIKALLDPEFVSWVDSVLANS